MKNYFGITIFFVMSVMNLLVAGDSTPTVSRIRGNQYTPGVAGTQVAGPIGTLVPTGIFGTNGILNLSGQVFGAQAVATTVLDTGIIAVVCSDGVNTYIVEYSSQGQLYTGFSAGTGNVLTLSGLANPGLSLIVDEQQRFLIAGQDDTNGYPWIRRITVDGSVDTSFVFTHGSDWGSNGLINRLSILSSGQILAVGFAAGYAMMGLYNLDGSIVSTFGNNGYIVLNGNASYPLSNNPLNTIVVDAYDYVYLAYTVTSSSVYVIRLLPSGQIDSSWNNGLPVHINYLDSASMLPLQLCMALNSAQDLIVAVPSGNSPTTIKAASIKSSDASAGSFADFQSLGGVFGSDSFSLSNILTTSDGKVYFVGSDTTYAKMAIIRVANTGILDTTFNSAATPGVNFFWTPGGMPPVEDVINSIALAPTGQIFVAGYELNSGTTTPYLSCLYSDQYVYEYPQFFQSQEQGVVDLLFGQAYKETNPGVVTPYVGLYKSSMQQKAETIIELASGKILMGSSGYTNGVSYTSMILVRLTSAGILDNSFGSGGTLILPNATTPSITNEYITNILEDGSGNIYVSGYSNYGAIFRKYTAEGLLLWNADYQVTGFAGFAVGLDADLRVVLFLAGPSGTGQINAYDPISGAFDQTFDNNGILTSAAFGLNMGPLYSGTIDSNGTIYVAYKNTATNFVDVAAINRSGLSIAWHQTNIFSLSANVVLQDNIRISCNKDSQLVIVVGSGASYKMITLNPFGGEVITGPTTITCGVDLYIRQLIGISDGTMVIVGYDNNADDAILVVRLQSNGTLDTTFNSQGPLPGTSSIQIGQQIANYFSRVGAGITVQSHIGINQGNLVLTGYEQMFFYEAMPVVMRIFGAPGTTQVKNFVVPERNPGGFDISYNGDGIAETYVLGASSPIANQEVAAIRQLTGTQIMTVVTDKTTSISYTTRLNADSSVDTTYGQGLGIAIAKIDGDEQVTSMVFDGVGNFLITGSHSNLGGFIKRVLPTGSMDTTFGNGGSYPLGTVYGIMDIINSCQQLTNGNIVVVGAVDGVGCIQILNSAGTQVLDFGIGGMVSTGVNITSVSVDPLNNIYASVAYYDNAVLKAGIIKLNSLGLRDNSFGINGFISNALSALDAVGSLRFAFDNQLRMCIAGSAGGVHGQLLVNRYSSTGAVDVTFNNGSELIVVDFPFIQPVVVTSLVTLEDNKILVSGYQSGSVINNNCEFVACVDDAGQLDATFGRQSPPGLVTFQALPTPQLERRLTNMNVQSDGNILLSGGEVPQVNYETPLTMRLYGYIGVQPVPQFTGAQSSLPIVLNPSFNGTGVTQTSVISQLDTFGGVATDGFARSLVGGITSDGFFKVARFLRNGLADTIENGGTGFGIDGIASTTLPMVGISGGSIAVDVVDRIYVGGIVNSSLVVARFTNAGVLDTTYGINGIASSAPVIFNISGGGFVTVDTLQRCVVSGFTTAGDLVVTRFETNGTTDTDFATSATDYITYVNVPGMVSAGGLVTDDIANIYLGVRTSDTLVAVMVTRLGALNTSYGTNGFAVSDTIQGLIEGGAIASNSHNQIVLGGLNSNQQFVVVRFRITGDVDPIFNGNGIAFSNPVDVLNHFGGIAVDRDDKPIVGGIASGYQTDKSGIVARFTIFGTLDTSFSTTGMATTGPISDLFTGGAVTTNIFDCIFIGGMTADQKLVLAQMYSGQEIFVTDVTALSPADVRIYYYGTSRSYLEKVLSIKYLARVITNPLVALSVIASVNGVIRGYDALYSTEPGRNNLVWNFYVTQKDLEIAKIALIALYSGYQDEIQEFFSRLELRSTAMKISSPLQSR